MSRFTGKLSVEFFYQGECSLISSIAILNEPLVWECDVLGSGLEVTVPAGFHSDGVSMPRMFWWFMPPWGDNATRAAILHDYLLLRLRTDPVPTVETRQRCDWQFYLALKALGVPEWRARILWWGVRTYAWLHGLDD